MFSTGLDYTMTQYIATDLRMSAGIFFRSIMMSAAKGCDPVVFDTE